MTPEQLARNLYTYLIAASRIDNMPIGFRIMTWDEVVLKDPHQADRWRQAITAFLDGIGAKADGEDHLTFIGELEDRPPPDPDAEPGEDHRITPDGG